VLHQWVPQLQQLTFLLQVFIISHEVIYLQMFYATLQFCTQVKFTTMDGQLVSGSCSSESLPIMVSVSPQGTEIFSFFLSFLLSGLNQAYNFKQGSKELYSCPWQFTMHVWPKNK